MQKFTLCCIETSYFQSTLCRYAPATTSSHSRYQQQKQTKMNIGEEIVAVYLQNVKNCEFVQLNLYTDVQGEIDVVGIDINNKRVFACEVAIHLITGRQYTKDNQPNNVEKIVEKFSRDIDYINKYFPDYEKHFMLWSPIVKNQSENSKHNQLNDVNKIVERILNKYNTEIVLIINDRFQQCLNELRDIANKETKEMKSPVMRYLQLEEKLKKHIDKLSNKQ